MNTTFKRTLAALAALAICWAQAQGVNSMRGADVSEADAAPSAKAYLGSKPGAQGVIARTFDKQPPLIPHKVEGFDDITPTDNACLDCHINDKYRGQKIPRIGASHFVPKTDPKAAPEVSMLRWQCNSCHVPQVDAPALVENQFKGTPTAKKK
ncbi:MAG: nitrate reductase cytochrome c-type subunit [Rhodoferax sp.]